MKIKEEGTDGSSRSNDTLSSTAVSPIDFTATMQDEYPSRQFNNTSSSSTCHHRQSRRRKVRFMDEVVDTSQPNSLVTSIRFRPSTKAEDKHITILKMTLHTLQLKNTIIKWN